MNGQTEKKGEEEEEEEGVSEAKECNSWEHGLFVAKGIVRVKIVRQNGLGDTVKLVDPS